MVVAIEWKNNQLHSWLISFYIQKIPEIETYVLLFTEPQLTFAAMAAAVICEEELSSVEATPLSFFSSSSSSHCTPLSSVCLWGLMFGGGERGGGGEGRSSSSSWTSFTFTMASRKRSMAWGRAGSINWKHSCA